MNCSWIVSVIAALHRAIRSPYWSGSICSGFRSRTSTMYIPGTYTSSGSPFDGAPRGQTRNFAYHS